MSSERTPALFDPDSLAPAESAAAPSTPLTVEQRAAVAHRDSSLLLAASAGSGKTAVLVERFVAAVLEDRIAASRILAITFTERAAGELRERVRQRFLELGMRALARDTETAFVTTIHGFCARVLREQALAAGLDPRFGVLDEPSARALRDDAFARTLRILLNGPERRGTLDLVAAWGVDRSGAAILGLHDQLRSRGSRKPSLPERTAAADLERSRAALLSARDCLDTRLRAIPEPPSALSITLKRLERCRELLDRPSGSVPGAAALAELALGRAATGARSGEETLAFAQALGEYERACADHRALDTCRVLDRMLAEYAAAYEQAKHQASALDFDDLELMTRDLLADRPALRADWAERFELLMVDEFQDTNRRQLEIVHALERNNLLCVGDEFQSIYSFRHADLEIFRERRAASEATATLAGNFRTRGGILDTISAAFAGLFGEQFVGLRPCRDAPPAPPVELLLTDIRGWPNTGTPGAPAGTPWRWAEARLLARRLDELVAEEDVRLGDVAVLLRAASDMALYEAALEERGLPTLATGSSGFWQRPEVADLLAYLRVLANPLDEPALYGLLASPMVGISRDALGLVALAGRRRNTGPWPALLGALDPADDGPGRAELEGALSVADREALRAIVTRIRQERPRAPGRATATLIEDLIAEFGAGPPGIGAGTGAERRMANVAKLARRARGYEAAHGRDLRGFLDHAAAQARSGAREPDAPVADEGLQAVRLMTIHAAKGLEFPTVCVADLGRGLGADTPPVIVDGPRVGIRLAGLDGSPALPALDYDELSRERQDAALREEQRIFYVAMTRARDRLLLSGALDPSRRGPVRASAPPVHWLARAVVPELDTELESSDAVREVPAAGGGRVLLRLNSPTPEGAPAIADPTHPPRGRLRVARLQPTSQAAAPADAPAPRHRPPSLSYTALEAYHRCGYRFYVQRVLGLPDEQPRGAARPPAPGDGRARGLLAHAALEELDFARARPPRPAALAAVASARGLSVSRAEVAEVASLLEAFIDSPLCARLAVARRLRREHPFALALSPDRDGPLLTGIIDAIADEDDGVLVVDYKTDRLAPAPAADSAEVYPIQRAVYALALLRAGAPRVEVAHCFLGAPETPISRIFEASDADALQQQVQAPATEIERGRFAVAEHPHRDLCLTCPARRRLCSWEEQMTLRDAPETGDEPIAALQDVGRSPR